MSVPHVAILGGGPAGVGAAYQLRRTRRASVTLLEQQGVVGGNAGSFEAWGQRLDYGSHRLHAACDPGILADIQRLLKGDLVDRQRHGRIRLREKWLHFPLKPLDLFLRLDRGFAIGATGDMLARFARRAHSGSNGSSANHEVEDTFASVLLENLGPTICQQFYFTYARKIWGRPPEELAAVQARKRVSAGSFRKLARRLIKPPGAGRFFYPRRGYGQISEAYADAARDEGAELLLGWRVTSLAQTVPGGGWTLVAERDGERHSFDADYVWSTIPISLLARMMRSPPPARVLDAAQRIEYRAMVLVYLHLDVDRFTSTDAHYFPERSVVFTRVSEPKNYPWLSEPRGSTTLCAELPCSPGDAIWELSDEALGQWVAKDLRRAGLPLARPPVDVTVRRLRQAYPIYSRGYEEPFGVLDDWARSLPNVLTYGRQGLFAHDNTHHALFMAYCATECLRDGAFDSARWEEYRKVFATHVVED